MAPTTEEDRIDELVDGADVLVAFEPTPLTLRRFVTDVAQHIHPYDEIAKRYGLTEVSLRQYIAERPHLMRLIKTERAIWESNDSAASRIKELGSHSLLQAMPVMGDMLVDPTIPSSSRVDMAKLHARMAGVDAPPANNGREGGGATPGAQFAVNIHFSGGSVERISATVVEPVPVLEIDGETA